MDNYPTRVTYERRPVSDPPSPIGHALLAGAFTFGALFGWLQGSYTGSPWLLALAGASVMALIVQVFLLAWGWFATFSETTRETPVVPDTAEPLPVRPEFQPSERTIKRGSFEFTPAQWAKLHEALQVSGWKMTRDAVRLSGIFTKEQYDKGWGGTLRDFQRIGFVIDGGRQVTEDGKRWIAQFSPPPPPNGLNAFAPRLGRAGESE